MFWIARGNWSTNRKFVQMHRDLTNSLQRVSTPSRIPTENVKSVKHLLLMQPSNHYQITLKKMSGLYTPVFILEYFLECNSISETGQQS